ncbi:MAG TPA: hypothetical protein VM093_01590, partial [Aeromicrobium sp.]|nr:hypothetical protein [Aeromicrobium sp.]
FAEFLEPLDAMGAVLPGNVEQDSRDDAGAGGQADDLIECCAADWGRAWIRKVHSRNIPQRAVRSQ